ncbi:hypothetical protein [Haloquadratum walsbyi]|jgi:hypothetical protein|uniref:Cox cluster protein n=1 Tax=Haloquadratum walsbyi (strain DSM 16790 / HBSQ001) TaxID=362976 RepID=Q18GY9_HALWD|nr:hypothetical protein [Haloquadratum walsbyi]CAJ52756.1 uncharacterized protein HQ_2645A [Haloquadratum walsbyi DSM 16790]
MTSAEETASSTSNDTNVNADGDGDVESTMTTEESSSTRDTNQPKPSPQGQPGLGRRILLTLGGIVIILSAGIGWIVGSNAAQTVARIKILNTPVAIPITPLSLSLYGILVSSLFITVLFGLVLIASRIESHDEINVDGSGSTSTGTDRDY